MIVAQTVEEVFVRQGLVWHLHIGGQVIRTTAEHPFYAWGKGWVACHELSVGDTLLAEDGRWLTVEDLLDTGVWETVYNLRVAEFHTYFVGCDEWGFSVWAHNASYRNGDTALDNLASKDRIRTMVEAVDDELAVAQTVNKNGQPDGFRTRSTVGIAEVVTVNGNREIWIAGAGLESDIPPGIRSMLEAGDVNPEGLLVRHVEHTTLDPNLTGRQPSIHINDAEMHIARTAEAEGATIRTIGATKDTCSYCQTRLLEDFNVSPESIATLPVTQVSGGFRRWNTN